MIHDYCAIIITHIWVQIQIIDNFCMIFIIFCILAFIHPHEINKPAQF